MGAASGCRKWVPQVGAASGCRKWVPQVGAASGCRKWVPQVGAASGCRKWVPQVGAGYRRLVLPLIRPVVKDGFMNALYSNENIENNAF